jgi:hypothetical protein
VKVIVTALAAAALAATALVAPTATAAPAPAAEPTARTVVKKTFSFYAKFTSRQVAPYGNAKAIGDLTITQGTVSDMAGKKVGTLTTVLRVVAPSPKKDAELRDTQSQIQLKDGQIFAQSVNEDPKGKPPVDLHVMPVTGGTGAYASARGTLLMRKVGDKYLMAYDIFVDKDLKAQTFTFDNIVEAAHQGSAPQGIGDVSLLRATGATNSYVLIATRAGDARGIVTDAVDMQVVTATGSLFARTIARGKAGPAQASTFAVLGGTGSLSGYRGELTLSANGRSITALGQCQAAHVVRRRGPQPRHRRDPRRHLPRCRWIDVQGRRRQEEVRRLLREPHRVRRDRRRHARAHDARAGVQDGDDDRHGYHALHGGGRRARLAPDRRGHRRLRRSSGPGVLRSAVADRMAQDRPLLALTGPRTSPPGRLARP